MNQMDLWHAIIRMGDWRRKGQPRLESLPPTQVQESAAAGQGDLAATLIGWVKNLVKTSRGNGISVAVDSSTFWEHDLLEKDPDAQAVFAGGQKSGPCPSYRGPAFTEAIQRQLAVTEAGVSYIMSDEEEYGNGNYTTACVCPRCEARWKDWLKINRPGLPYISPKDVITKYSARPKVAAFDKLENRQEGAEAVQSGNALIEEQYRAWLYFRASLTTERYQYFKKELEKTVATSGAKSSPKPLVGWWAGAAEDYTLLVCMQDGRALAGVIDRVVPQLYFRYGIPPRRFREVVRRHCWALDGKNTCAGIDTDASAELNAPGNLTPPFWRRCSPAERATNCGTARTRTLASGPRSPPSTTSSPDTSKPSFTARRRTCSASSPPRARATTSIPGRRMSSPPRGRRTPRGCCSSATTGRSGRRCGWSDR